MKEKIFNLAKISPKVRWRLWCRENFVSYAGLAFCRTI